MKRAELATDRTLMFWCPGCDEAHGVSIDKWAWNGSLEAPTISPSIVIGRKTWLKGFEEQLVKCHSYVRDGRIEFLSDCTHALAGTTVDLPAWEKGANGEETVGSK